ncbi:MAG: hypothetical protein AAB696_00580 [Patescibacteria group bacterium]
MNESFLIEKLENNDITNIELLQLIASSDDINRKNARERLLEREPLYNGCFSDIVARANSTYYKEKAWGLLLARSTNDIHFCMIFSHNTDLNNPYLKKAWEKIIKSPTTDSYSFCYLIDYAQQPYKGMALDQFLKRCYPLRDLKNLLCGRQGKETEFWKEKIEILFKK